MCSMDSISLNGYTFKHPPTQLDVSWEPQRIKHTLSDGTLITYNKGFILKGNLGWGEGGWIDDDEYSNIAVMYNQNTATALFYPRTETYGARKFNVQLSNEFNFVPHKGHLQIGKQFYMGNITFESSVGEITATASVIF